MWACITGTFVLRHLFLPCFPFCLQAIFDAVTRCIIRDSIRAGLAVQKAKIANWCRESQQRSSLTSVKVQREVFQQPLVLRCCCSFDSMIE